MTTTTTMTVRLTNWPASSARGVVGTAGIPALRYFCPLLTPSADVSAGPRPPLPAPAYPPPFFGSIHKLNKQTESQGLESYEPQHWCLPRRNLVYEN